MHKRALQPKIFLFIVLVISALSPIRFAAADEGPVIERIGGSVLDWSSAMLRATGEGEPVRTSDVDLLSLRNEARRLAEESAFRNLWRSLRLVPINQRENLGERLAKTPEIEAGLKKALREFKVNDVVYFSDGVIKISVEIPLGPLVGIALGHSKESPPKVNVAKGRRVYSGLILNVQALPFYPILAPMVVGEDGSMLYGIDYVSGEALAKRGIIGYTASLVDAKKSERIGGNPLVIKILRLGARNELVLPSNEALLLREENVDFGFLEEGRVMIVVSNERPG